MIRKPRILWVGESTFLKTGYGIYGHEVLSRLHSTGKYDIAELGIYGHLSDARAQQIPWTYYGNTPDTIDDNQRYNSVPANQWGLWKFEDTCLDFKPDIVIDIRDWWMYEYVARSPYRNFFHWAIMPTIDSAPQMETWLSTYINADSVLAYSEFGRDTILEETNNNVNFCGIASPAADYDILKPVANKQGHKEAMGFEKNINIIGTIMRNQKRKLYPDLINAFKKFCEAKPSIAKDTFLYLHTSYPDIGWDIPRLIRESGIGHKIICTYICHQCGHVFPSFFHDAIQTCPKCNSYQAKLPSSEKGVSLQELAAIINCFDLYVQYSICEGFGMPQVEAAACGVPVMAVDYSAMSSVVRNIKGIPLKVQRMFRESETHAWRALPDNDYLVSKLINFFSKSQGEKFKMSRDTYLACQKAYQWDKAAKTWENVFDNVELKEHSETWDSPANIKEYNLNIPPNLNNSDFVRWCVANIWGEPTEIESYVALRMIRDLNYGEAVDSYGGAFYSEDSMMFEKSSYINFGKEEAVRSLMELADQRNYWEQKRTGLINEEVPLFIQHAKRER